MRRRAGVEQARQEERQALYAQLQQAQEQQQAAYERQLNDHVHTFAAGKNYWPQIENEILYHVLALKGTNPDMPPLQILEIAHDKALAARPEIDPRQQQKSQTEMAERKRKADQAKRLASLNVGSRSIGRSVPVSKSMEETMRAVADRLMPNH